jgi:glutaredoxin
MWAWLRSWWHRPARRRRVVMYTRIGCHLCEDAWKLLESAATRHPLDLSQIDIDTDTELAARYGHEVPVVEIDGKVRFRGRVNPVLLTRLLR